MIISVEDLKKLPEFKDQDSSVLEAKLEGIEILVRKYTNNNFQNRNIRFLADSAGTVLNGVSPFLKVGTPFRSLNQG